MQRDNTIYNIIQRGKLEKAVKRNLTRDQPAVD